MELCCWVTFANENALDAVFALGARSRAESSRFSHFNFAEKELGRWGKRLLVKIAVRLTCVYMPLGHSLDDGE